MWPQFYGTILFVILLINTYSRAVWNFYFHPIVTRLTLIRIRITMRARLHLKRVIAVSKSLHRENTVTMCAIFSWIIATITATGKGWEECEVKPAMPLWRSSRLRRSSRKHFLTGAHSLENGCYIENSDLIVISFFPTLRNLGCIARRVLSNPSDDGFRISFNLFYLKKKILCLKFCLYKFLRFDLKKKHKVSFYSLY